MIYNIVYLNSNSELTQQIYVLKVQIWNNTIKCIISIGHMYKIIYQLGTNSEIKWTHFHKDHIFASEKARLNSFACERWQLGYQSNLKRMFDQMKTSDDSQQTKSNLFGTLQTLNYSTNINYNVLFRISAANAAHIQNVLFNKATEWIRNACVLWDKDCCCWINDYPCYIFPMNERNSNRNFSYWVHGTLQVQIHLPKLENTFKW